jgi:uncharacterized membrane protein YkgB
MSLSQVDLKIIKFLRRFYEPGARAAIFIIFFWFGALKVFGKSPANPLVEALLHQTLPFVYFSNFIIFFGAFEMLLGLLFIIKGAERVLMPLFALHMFTTALPLFLLPQITWQGFLTPTLEGQYIIKNLTLIALAIMIASHLKPIKEDK